MKEYDPYGLDPHTEGAKLDQGKDRVGLVFKGFCKALRAVSRVGTYGAGKYTDDGWKSVPDPSCRYMDALLRHLLDMMGGEDIDPESELLHKAHLAWNALAILELELEEECKKQSLSTLKPQDYTSGRELNPSIFQPVQKTELQEDGNLKSTQGRDSQEYQRELFVR